MDYFAPLDVLFSSGWLSFGVLFGLAALGLLFRKPLFYNRKNKGWLGFLYAALFMGGLFTILIFNPTYFGYGKSIGMKQAMIEGNGLYILDYRLQAGGEGDDPTPYYRVHVVDLKSGEKKKRFLIGPSADILFVNGKEIVVEEYGKPHFYNAETGKLISAWSEETLPELYPELKPGVAQMQRYDEWVKVTSKDGQQWVLNMRDHKITSQENLPSSWQNTKGNSHPLEATEDGFLRETDGQKDYASSISLEGKTYDDRRKQLRNSSDSLLNKELFFVEGRPVAVSEKDNVLIILHYETTDKMNFIITGVSLDAKKKIWELRQTTLHPNGDDTPTETCWTSDIASGILIFCAEDEVITIRMKDGEIFWEKTL